MNTSASLFLVLSYTAFTLLGNRPFLNAFLLGCASATSLKTPEDSSGRGWAKDFQPYDKNDDIKQQPKKSDLHPKKTQPFLQVPCALRLAEDLDKGSIEAFRTMLDTSSQRTTLSLSAIARAPFLLTLLDKTFSDKSNDSIIGRLPAGLCHMVMGGDDTIVISPTIYVVDTKPQDRQQDGGEAYEPEFVLGLDFMYDHDTIINLRSQEIILYTKEGSNTEKELSVSLIRPRSLNSVHLDVTGE